MNCNNDGFSSYLPDPEAIRSKALSRRSLLQGTAGAALGLFLAAPRLAWSKQAGEEDGQDGMNEIQELLSLALQHEHGAFVQYANHAGIMSHKLEKDVSSIYQEIIADEVGHAISLVQALQTSGAKPSLAVWPARSHQDPAELLRQDVAAEENALDVYQRILKLDMDSKLYTEIESILNQEKEHKIIFSDMLQELG
ncbi:MAG: ferritin-like domain-containing protein [Desulfohalobiaceae bacterium]